jgi:hypothetical protein
LLDKSGGPGTLINWQAIGFGPNEVVDFDYNGEPLNTCTTNGTGYCYDYDWIPRDNPTGWYNVTGTGESSGLSASAAFDQNAALIYLDNWYGVPGDTKVVDAQGYAANETVDFTYNGAPIGSCTTDGTGSCSTSYTVPSGNPPGTYDVVGTGETSGLSASDSFDQLAPPTPTPTPTTAPP